MAARSAVQVRRTGDRLWSLPRGAELRRQPLPVERLQLKHGRHAEMTSWRSGPSACCRSAGVLDADFANDSWGHHHLVELGEHRLRSRRRLPMRAISRVICSISSTIEVAQHSTIGPAQRDHTTTPCAGR